MAFFSRVGSSCLNIGMVTQMRTYLTHGYLSSCANEWATITSNIPQGSTFGPNSRGTQQRGAIRLIDNNRDVVAGPFFARQKAAPGEWRPFVSHKMVNLPICYQKFRMTTVKDIKLWVGEGHFPPSINLSDALFFIALNKTFWRHQRIQLRILQEVTCVL